MSKYWLRFGCYLISYDFAIFKHCGSASRQTVSKYTSAILLLCLIWGVDGYLFAHKYITDKSTGIDFIACFVAMAMIFIVVQIERQIILSLKPSITASVFRWTIGFAMALVGAMIMDQWLFKNDIQRADQPNIARELDSMSHKPPMNILQQQIDSLNVVQLEHSMHLKTLRKKIENEPLSHQKHTLVYTKPEVLNLKSSSGADSSAIQYGTSYDTNFKDTTNPAMAILEHEERRSDEISRSLAELLKQKTTALVSAQAAISKNRGFLVELTALYNLLFKDEYPQALIVYAIFFFIFSAIEMFVLITKFKDRSDYDEILQHQLVMRSKQLLALQERSNQPNNGKA